MRWCSRDFKNGLSLNRIASSPRDIIFIQMYISDRWNWRFNVVSVPTFVFLFRNFAILFLLLYKKFVGYIFMEHNEALFNWKYFFHPQSSSFFLFRKGLFWKEQQKRHLHSVTVILTTSHTLPFYTIGMYWLTPFTTYHINYLWSLKWIIQIFIDGYQKHKIPLLLY